MKDRFTNIGIFGVYYLTLLVYLIASYFPEHRAWGFNWWAYYPDWVRWTLFGIGALVPVALRFIPRTEVNNSDHTEEADTNDRKFFVYVGVITAVFGSLFYLLRTRTHFLGDGYTLLSSLASDSPLAMKTREYGESLLHIVLKNLIGGDSQTAALLSYQIISITAGLLFVVTVAMFARKLYERTAERVLFLLGVCTGGYMLLFFGYVENYSLFVLSVLVFTLTGLMIAQGKTSRYWLLPPLFAAIFFHVLGVTLLPSALYLWIGPTRLGRTIKGWRPLTKLVAAIPILVVAAIVFYHFYTTNYFYQFAFVPLFENQFTVEGYTMFSWKHLVDFLNLLFLLVPGLLILFVSLSGHSLRRILKQQPYIYLLILISNVLGAVFIFDPKLGMPRDWDLFSFAGVPLVVAATYIILYKSRRLQQIRIGALMIFLSTVVLLPRVAGQCNAKHALTRLQLQQEMDPVKCRPVQAILESYCDLTGSIQADSLLQTHWIGRYKQVGLHDSALVIMNAAEFSAAANMLRRALAIDPFFWNAWTTLGLCLSQSGNIADAEEALNLAIGINPYNAGAYNNLGAVYTRKGKLTVAESMYLRSISLDSTNMAPFVGLTNVYRLGRREQQFRQLLIHTTERFDAPGLMYKDRGDVMLSLGQLPAAADAYRRAMEKGLDSSYVQQLIEQHPNLRKFLE